MKNAAFLILALCSFTASAQDYFPKGAFSNNFERDELTANSYSGTLEALEEYPIKEGETSYRFSWFRSFHPMVIIRVSVNEAGEPALTLKIRGETIQVRDIETVARYVPFRRISEITRILKDEEFARLENKLASCEFQHIQSYSTEMPGSDGSRWIIEAQKKSDYHVIDRWTPQSGCVHDIGKLFIELTQHPFKEIY